MYCFPIDVVPAVVAFTTTTSGFSNAYVAPYPGIFSVKSVSGATLEEMYENVGFTSFGKFC